MRLAKASARVVAHREERVKVPDKSDGKPRDVIVCAGCEAEARERRVRAGGATP